MHWFNPLLYRIRKQINSDCEFSCDEAVIAGLDCMERRSYGDTLLNSIDTNYIRRKKRPSCFAERFLQGRIQ